MPDIYKISHITYLINTYVSHIRRTKYISQREGAIVDTTKMNKDEIKDAMTQYAESGRVSSGPAAPKGLARWVGDCSSDYRIQRERELGGWVNLVGLALSLAVCDCQVV